MKNARVRADTNQWGPIMSKSKPQDQSLAKQHEVILQTEQVRALVQRAVEQQPDLRHVRGSGEEAELRALKLATDTGIEAQRRDGWRAVVTDWWVSVETVEDVRTGELLTLPVLALLSVEGEVCRLSGLPALHCWQRLLEVAGVERLARGVPVRVRRRQSSTVGRSYWTIEVDIDWTMRDPGAEG